MNFKSVPGYEGLYEVSDTGIVVGIERTIKTNTGIERRIKRREMIIRLTNRGYLSVRLSRNGENKPFLVHRLVAAAFHPNPDQLPQVNHIDGNRLNNNASNLE